jgi:hypothetical protein
LRESLAEDRWFGDSEVSRRVAAEWVMAANSAGVLVGLAAIVLGILGLVGLVPLTLSLVAFLCVGAAVMFAGSAVTAKMMAVMPR